MQRHVLLKLESLQITGSFKARGAVTRLAALAPEERRAGVVACSSGNHGRAVAWAARRLGVPATVCVPEWVDPVKLEGIRGQGAEALLTGATFDEAEARAIGLARNTGRTYVSAYDDPWVIAGQGTLALEVLDALDTAPAAVLAPLSGGGLIGGIAAALRGRLGSDAPPAVAVTAERARDDAGQPRGRPARGAGGGGHGRERAVWRNRPGEPLLISPGARPRARARRGARGGDPRGHGVGLYRAPPGGGRGRSGRPGRPAQRPMACRTRRAPGPSWWS